MAKQKFPNDVLRAARVQLFGTQQALADAANKHLPPAYLMSANDVGKLERGVVERPSAIRREALKAAIGATDDCEIGFMKHRSNVASLRLPTSTLACSQFADTGPGVTNTPSPQQLTLKRASTPMQTGWRIVGYLAASQPGTESPALTIIVPNGSAVFEIDGLTAVAPNLVSAPADHSLDPDGDWDSFLTVTRLLAGQRQAVAPAALLSLVEAHRDCLAALFRRAKSDPLRTHIGAMLAEASIVASRLWSAQGNRSMALVHCAHARTLGNDLRIPALTATAQIFESNLHSNAASLIGGGGDLVLGLRMLEEAEARSAFLAPAARARLAAEQAQGFAVLGLRRDCEAALDRARTAVESIGASDQTGLFSDWNPSRLRVYEGTCRLFLDEPKKAVTLLEEAADGFASDANNANVNLAAQIDLASAYAETGELERSCAILGDTYGQLTKNGNLRGIHRAAQARERLGRWSSEVAVRELDARMATCRAA